MPRKQPLRCPRCGFFLSSEGMKDVKNAYPKSFQPWTREEYLKLQALVREGLTILELSEHLGRSPTAIQAKCELLGIKISERQPEPETLEDPDSKAAAEFLAHEEKLNDEWERERG